VANRVDFIPTYGAPAAAKTGKENPYFTGIHAPEELSPDHLLAQSGFRLRRPPMSLCPARLIARLTLTTANATATVLVNPPLDTLNNGRAEVHDFLCLSNRHGERHAPTGDRTQARFDEAADPGSGATVVAGVAAGCIAGAGDNGPLLAGKGF
jgi:hypothetical protein